jgi:protein SCO1/2
MSSRRADGVAAAPFGILDNADRLRHCAIMSQTPSPSPALTRIRLVLWVLVALAAIGATALFFLRPPAGPLAVTGTPFALTSTKGGTFTQDDLKGTPSLVFFGYTFCPDVCPTTMAEIVAWRQALELSPDQLRTIFVTVDPARDTVPVLKGYLEGFDPSVIGLVGDDAETQAVKAAFGASSEKVGDGDYYLVNHTASVFLLDRNGRFQGTIAFGEDRQAALAKIKRLVGS